MLGPLLHTLRTAARRLRRTPGASLAVVGTLALGLAGVTLAFALVRGIALDPLPYPEAHRLVRLHGTLDALRDAPNPRLAAIWNRLPVSYLDAEDWRQRSRTLSTLGLHAPFTAVVQGDGPLAEPRDVPAARAEPELFDALGVEPRWGRGLGDAGEDSGEARVLLSHGFWQQVLGGDPGGLGEVLSIDGVPHTVVGVMPPSFSLTGFDLAGAEERLWIPLEPTEDDLTSRDNAAYTAIGRLAPGVTLEEARREMDRFAAELAREFPETREGSGLRVAALEESVAAEGRRWLPLLALVAVAVLLVACLDVAHLLLARGTRRRRERAVRLALGARPGSLLAGILTEAVLLALAGSLVGLGLATLGARAVPRLLAAELPHLRLAMDASVVAFAVLAAFAAALVAVLPVAGEVLRRGLRLELRQALQQEPASGDTPSRRGGRRLDAHGLLVIAQIALTLVVAVGAALLAGSVARLAAMDPGFEPRGILAQEFRLPDWSYGGPGGEARRESFRRRLLQRVEALPGVVGAALMDRLPVTGPAQVWGFRIAGRDAPLDDWTQGRSAVMQFVTPGYLELLGVPQVAGARLAEGTPRAEDPGPQRVWVNESLARAHFPAGDAVGSRVVMLGDVEYTVAGVFGDIRHQGLEKSPGELMLQPWHQDPWAQGAPVGLALLVARAEAADPGGSPEDLAPMVRGVIRDLDPSLPLPPAVPLAERMAESALAGPRVRALGAGGAAALAWFLALVGTYGVIAHGVARRRRELGIRLALGAGRGSVQRRVLGRALGLASVGVVVGAVAAVATGRLLQGLLPGVAVPGAAGALGGVPWTWWLSALGLASAWVLVTALAAAWLPARRAAGQDPAESLRHA